MLNLLAHPPFLAGLSFALGCGLGFTRLRKAWSAAIPFLLFATIVMYAEHCMPYSGGGASMWPLAIIVGGGLAAGSSFIGCVLVTVLRKRP